MDKETLCAKAAMSQSAAWMVSVLRVAVAQDKNLIRALLAEVFDLSDVKNQAHFIAASVKGMSKDAQETRELMHAVHADFTALEKRQDAILFAQEQLENRLDRIEERLASVEQMRKAV